MSEKLTRIRLPGSEAFRGLQNWGEKSAAEMVNYARSYAARLRAEAEAIEGASDADFQIDIVRGPYVQRHVREVQKAGAA